MTARPLSLVFQAGKLGDIPQLLEELAWAESLLPGQPQVGRVYGVSGGALSALGFVLAAAAERDPGRFGAARGTVRVFAEFLRRARSRDIRRFNLNPMYGPFNLRPLRSWAEKQLGAMGLRQDLRLAELPVLLYLCAMDRDGTFTLFGSPDPGLQFEYTWARVGPPQDASVVDALTAALSTLLSTEPQQVNGQWYRDCRPAMPDARAIVADLEAADARPILGRAPYTPAPPWGLNFISSPFIMHRWHERNQSLLTQYYLDLLERDRALQARFPGEDVPAAAPSLWHVDLPYVGSTEALTNLRVSVANKHMLMARFRSLLNGQLDGFPFHQPANVIYGAGGFSGILAGLVTTRAVEAGFRAGGGVIRQIYGVSAGVLNGFFHAVQVGAEQHPELYRPPARQALADLERFFEHVTIWDIGRPNLDPREFWLGWGNLGRLEEFLLERLAAYTGSHRPERLTFDDIALPLTVAAARDDGLTDFLGMARLARRMHFGGVELEVRPAPVVRALIAGWSMNTYVAPTRLNGQHYRDGGGSFYDPALFAACLDRELVNLLDIHLDEPDGHSYNLPPRPDLVRIVFDTHNYNFPEERRRMRFLSDLLYAHYARRARAAAAGLSLEPDFRQAWRVQSGFHSHVGREPAS